MNTKTQLQQYRGKLSPSEIAEGMNAARANAKRLAKDARILFDGESYASALALSILAIEEAGKEPVLRGLALASNDSELKKSWRDYKSHTKKNVLWPLIETYLQGARRADDFLPLFYPDAEHPFLLDQLKQISLYTDCFRKGHWSIPEKVITKEVAEAPLKIAEIFSQSRSITTDEIELWIQYLKPVWHKTDGSRERALFEWDKEIRRRGLAKESDTMTLEKFYVEGVNLPKKI